MLHICTEECKLCSACLNKYLEKFLKFCDLGLCTVVLACAFSLFGRTPPYPSKLQLLSRSTQKANMRLQLVYALPKYQHSILSCSLSPYLAYNILSLRITPYCRSSSSAAARRHLIQQQQQQHSLLSQASWGRLIFVWADAHIAACADSWDRWNGRRTWRNF
jgi:hypothetical protein